MKLDEKMAFDVYNGKRIIIYLDEVLCWRKSNIDEFLDYGCAATYSTKISFSLEVLDDWREWDKSELRAQINDAPFFPERERFYVGSGLMDNRHIVKSDIDIVFLSLDESFYNTFGEAESSFLKDAIAKFFENNLKIMKEIITLQG